MRSFRGLAVTIALIAFVPAVQAQKLDLFKTPCKQFVEGEKDKIIIISSWLSGYFADPDEPVLDFEDLTKKGQALADYCKANPTTDLITAAEPIYERK